MVIRVQNEPIVVLWEWPGEGLVVEAHHLRNSAIFGTLFKGAVNVDFLWIIGVTELKTSKAGNLPTEPVARFGALLRDVFEAYLEFGLGEAVVRLRTALPVSSQFNAEYFFEAAVVAEMACHGSHRLLPTLMPAVAEEQGHHGKHSCKTKVTES